MKMELNTSEIVNAIIAYMGAKNMKVDLNKEINFTITPYNEQVLASFEAVPHNYKDEDLIKHLREV